MSDGVAQRAGAKLSGETRRALWVVPVADLGGVARHVMDVTRVGIPGWSVTVLCPEGPLAERLREQGSTVVVAPFGPEFGALSSRRALARTINDVSPAIVHSHLAYADIISAVTRMPRGVRRITTEHGIAGDDRVYHRSSLHAGLMASIHRWRFRRFQRTIAVSGATRSAMIAKWRVKQPIAVIPNGIDPPGTRRSQLPSSGERLRILSLSRLAPEKRIDRLIEAFALVRGQHPDAVLTIAGEGPSQPELEAAAVRLGVEEHVRFAGFMNAERAIAESDVLVQLSVWENCSYTLLDAAARGLRVVASDVGGNREILNSESLVSTVDAATVATAIIGPHTSSTPQPVSGQRMCALIASAYESDSPQ